MLERLRRALVLDAAEELRAAHSALERMPRDHPVRPALARAVALRRGDCADAEVLDALGADPASAPVQIADDEHATAFHMRARIRAEAEVRAARAGTRGRRRPLPLGRVTPPARS